MYRDIVIRVFGEKAITKVEELMIAGIDLTDLMLSAIMKYEIKKTNAKIKCSC